MYQKIFDWLESHNYSGSFDTMCEELYIIELPDKNVAWHHWCRLFSKHNSES